MRMNVLLVSALIVAAQIPLARADHRDSRFNAFPRDCHGDVTIVQCMFGSDHHDDIWNHTTCAEARDMLAGRGYTKIKTVTCKGRLYVFKARWKGQSYELKVTRNSGALRSARKI